MFAGSRQIQVHDEARGLSFSVLILYPTEVPSTPTMKGPMLSTSASIFAIKG